LAAWAAVLASAGAGGCALGGARLAREDEAPRAVLLRYARSTPVRMQAVQSVVMSWRRRPFTALGWFRYDREQGTFALVGLSPAGATLFSLSEAGGHATGAFAALPGGDPEAWTQAMAADIRRIYFEGIARPDDEVRRTRHGVLVTRQLAGGGRLQLRLAAGRLRAEARWYVRGRRVGTTLSEDYEAHGPLRVPRRIVHRNEVYGYRLVIRTKEIQALEPAVAASASRSRP
jgi:hypothetical protein